MGSRKPMPFCGAHPTGTRLGNFVGRVLMDPPGNWTRVEIVSGGSGQNRRGSGREAFRHHGMVAAMPVQLAVRALFFDVSQLAARGELAVAADYAAAGERPK